MKNREIYKDRWMAWFFSFAIFTAIMLLGITQYTAIQIESDTTNNVFEKNTMGLSVLPEIRNGDCPDGDFECLKSFYKYEVPEYGSILELELESETFSAGGSLVISGRDGYAFYLSKDDKGGGVSAKGRFSDAQMFSLASLMKKKNFLSMTDSEPEKREDASFGYRITAKILPWNEKSGRPLIYSVSCVFPDCYRGFWEIKNKMVEFWSDAFICLDGCVID